MATETTIGMTITRNAVKEAMERYIDANGTPALLDALAELSHEKAEHVRTNWSDCENIARDWDKQGRWIARLRQRLIGTKRGG